MKKFSLIELLVVVAIIAILSSLLLPSLSKARKTAKLTQCLSTVRQMTISTHMYADDNDRYYPAAYANYGWDDLIASYYGLAWTDQEKSANGMSSTNYNYSRLLCPSDTVASESANKFRKSYVINDYKSSGNWNVGISGREKTGSNNPAQDRIAESIKTTSISNPSRTIVLGEHWNKWNLAGSGGDQSHGTTGYFYREYIFNPGTVAADKVSNHFGKGISNFSFADGSAKKMNSYQVLEGTPISNTLSNFRGSWFDSQQ
ncbi:type II secretion system protein [Lentisphaera marina]|uniref:prepilin-type N-terminal cleavage/methylation domain-containing protein n=1 Tax=Lentisphaera marina TaxID=1111041 RepID=UPI00236569E4|nr:type II secretion system protein [Lentisphaera marina]MDD7984568.1 type II secretion system protein [Lentisphaera marina]